MRPSDEILERMLTVMLNARVITDNTLRKYWQPKIGKEDFYDGMDVLIRDGHVMKYKTSGIGRPIWYYMINQDYLE